MDYAIFEKKPCTKSEINIIELNLLCLKQGANIATGDLVNCSSCQSILNSYSKLSRTEQNIIWTCEFCGSENVLSIEEEEIPAYPELTYIIESAVQVANSQNLVKKAPAVVFCVDISGSMCVSKAVEGKLNLKTSRLEELKKLLNPGEEDQRFADNVTYVSRLECVQAAIENQIQILSTCSPQLKLGLVAFNQDVRVFGDGTHDDLITGDKLFDFDELKSWANERKNLYFKLCIGDSCERLKNKVLELQEGGPTALGPALLVSIILASDCGPGSKVVICTDGLANIGVGSLDMDNDTDFYEILGNLATDLGVSVSIISIEGEECRLESLIKVIKTTGGDIVQVAPENISEEFANILSNDVIATHVNVEVNLHKSIEFKNEEPQNLSFMNSRLRKKVGNATAVSSFSFAYNLKADNELNELGINKEQLQTIPIQAVIEYVSLEGMKCVRVISKRQPVTFDREKAKGSSKLEVLARAGRRQAAWYAEQGRFSDVRECADEWIEEIQGSEVRNIDDQEVLVNFQSKIKELEEVIASEEYENLIYNKNEELICWKESDEDQKKNEIDEIISRIISKESRVVDLNMVEEYNDLETSGIKSRARSDAYVSRLNKLNKH